MPEADQMVANLGAAMKDMPSELERRRIEKEAESRHGAATSYFQEKTTLIQPTSVNVKRDGERVVVLWNTAMAGAEPIRSYEILAGDRLLLSLPYRPHACVQVQTLLIDKPDPGGERTPVRGVIESASPAFHRLTARMASSGYRAPAVMPRGATSSMRAMMAGVNSIFCAAAFCSR